MAFYNIFMGMFMIIGAMLGLLLRIEHNYTPFSKFILTLWLGVSVYGTVFYYDVDMFFFMNMVTMGWIAYPLIS
tara:strand:+ start:1530 stop:1751 length:222 start_codon:yes stop_codon:yes gene_type:complete